MNCFVCSREAGFNRALVGPGGAVRAGLCRGCESELFGTRLAALEGGDATTCAFCASAGAYVLGKWLPRHEVRDGDVHVENFVDRTDESVRLCHDHVRALRESRPARPPD